MIVANLDRESYETKMHYSLEDITLPLVRGGVMWALVILDVSQKLPHPHIFSDLHNGAFCKNFV